MQNKQQDNKSSTVCVLLFLGRWRAEVFNQVPFQLMPNRLGIWGKNMRNWDRSEKIFMSCRTLTGKIDNCSHSSEWTHHAPFCSFPPRDVGKRMQDALSKRNKQYSHNSLRLTEAALQVLKTTGTVWFSNSLTMTSYIPDYKEKILPSVKDLKGLQLS